MPPETWRRKAAFAGGLAATVLSAVHAVAHPVVPGITGFPALMLHPLLITHQALALIAAMLLIGRSPALSRWRAIVGFAAAVGLAHGAQGFLPGLFTYYWIAASALIAAAAAMAAAFDPIPARLALPAIIILGSVIGLDTDADTPGLWPRLEAVAAAIFTGTLLLLLAGFIGSYSLPSPIRLMARILAAWIAAATMMILAFALKA
jgi:hypothetical protein